MPGGDSSGHINFENTLPRVARWRCDNFRKYSPHRGPNLRVLRLFEVEHYFVRLIASGAQVWHTGITSIALILTRGGLVAAQCTVSAMSSELSGAAPS